MPDKNKHPLEEKISDLTTLISRQVKVETELLKIFRQSVDLQNEALKMQTEQQKFLAPMLKDMVKRQAI